MKKKTENIVLLMVLLIAYVGLVIAHVSPTYFSASFTKEDGLTEWLSVVALMFGSITCLYRAVTLRKRKSAIFLLVTLGLSGVYFFGAGEEISWGQRIFNITPGSFFAGNNSQGETNLHNLVINGVGVNKLIFGKILGIVMAIYFLILPVLHIKNRTIKNLLDRLGVPVPTFVHVGSMLLILIAAELTFSGKKGEIIEFGGTWIFFLLTLNPMNRYIYD